MLLNLYISLIENEVVHVSDLEPEDIVRIFMSSKNELMVQKLNTAPQKKQMKKGNTIDMNDQKGSEPDF